MKILILEDDKAKLKDIKQVISSAVDNAVVYVCMDFAKFLKEINKEKYDLIICDFMVPVFEKSEVVDISSRIIEEVRLSSNENITTPVIAITMFDKMAEDKFKDYNKYDVNIITYNCNDSDWKNYLERKVILSIPKIKFDFVIVCALDMEASAFSSAGYEVEQQYTYSGISCRNITINHHHGVIVIPPRMGLVNAAIISSRAIDLFEPKIICMSGICAGISGRTNIYDVIIPSSCDQHDSGKWSDNGFVFESYSVPLGHGTQENIKEIINRPEFIEVVKKGIILKPYECLSDSFDLEFEIYTAPTSSGSSVIANEEMLESIKHQHKRKVAFEMESYALYESARQSLLTPIFFSAKSVVDNGDGFKSDSYHRVASIISAKVVYNILLDFLNNDS